MTISRSKSLLLALVAAAAFPAAAVAQAQTPETHTVQGGDTLWDIARRYFGDPFLWPQIYRLNTAVVEDPHWIYPGEVLRLVGGEGVAAVPPEEPRPDTVEVALPLAEGPGALGAPPRAGDPAMSSESPLLRSERRTIAAEPTLRAYIDQAYTPLRRSEFYSAGFLTEGQALPFGDLLGPVTPQQIGSLADRSSATLFTRVAVRPPRGGSYQVGDTLLVVRLDRRIDNYGEVVVPTGLVRVLSAEGAELLSEVVAVYGPIRAGQRTLLAEKFTSGGTTRAVPISDGVSAQVISSRDRQELKGPLDVLFLNRGQAEGVAPGDIFEVRRTPSERPGEATTVEEVMATLQVVHAREHTATAKVLTVGSPDIPPGTEARQVAKLPT